MVTAQDQPQVGALPDEFFPDLLSGVVAGCLADAVFLLLLEGIAAAAAAPHVRVGQVHAVMVFVLVTCEQFSGPFERTVRRVELRRDDQEFVVPARQGEFIGRILQRGTAFAVGILRHQAFLDGISLALKGKIVRQVGVRVFRVLESVVVVPSADDVGDLSVYPADPVRYGFPHLPAALVQHAAVQGVVVVLLHHIAREEDGLDVQGADIIGHPCHAEVEKRLVEVVFDVALWVAEEDEGGSARLAQPLRIGPVLGVRQARPSGREKAQGGHRRHQNASVFHKDHYCFDDKSAPCLMSVTCVMSAPKTAAMSGACPVIKA